MLTHKALLNGIAGIIDQGSRILVSFVLTPVLVTHLGAVLFGVWQVLQRVSVQARSMDGRSSEVLKWVVSNLQNSDSDDHKKEALTAAILCALVFFPLLMIVNMLWIFYLPEYFNKNTLVMSDIQMAAGLLFINIIFMTMAAIMEAVIRGMNMAYKLVGVLSVILITGGIITGYLASQGYGIVVVAGSQIFIGFTSLLAYSYIAWRNIRWLGLKLPDGKTIKKSMNRSAWFTSWGFINVWILAGDVIVLGALVEAEEVSRYVLTLYASQMISMVILTAISAALPGLGGLIGNEEFERAEKLRKESMLYSWCLAVSICTTVIILNPSFVNLWVGGEQFSGYEVNALLAFSVFQLLFIRHDAFMLNLALDIRKKVLLGLFSSLFTLALMLLLVPEYGLIGMCLSLIIGRAVLTYTYPKVIAEFFRSRDRKVLGIRHYTSTVFFFVTAYQVSKNVQIDSWIVLVISALLIMVSILIFNYYAVLYDDQKRVTVSRMKAICSIRDAW